MKASTEVSELVRDDVRRLSPYALEQVECRFKLDQNEVPWDFPAALKRRVARRLVSCNWARYPDFHGDELRRALGHYHGWPWRGVLVGNGSNELLGLTLEAVTAPGREVLGTLPSFGLYEMFVRRSGGVPRFLGAGPDLQLPMADLLAEIGRDPRRPVLICSPNNPTGAAAAPGQLSELIGASEGPVLLDNAYGEFCRHDYRPLLRQHPNLILFRTLSKAWSLAGIRLGYLLARPGLVEELTKVKLPYNVGHAAVSVGLVALEATGQAERRVRLICRRRQQWLEMIRRLGLEVFESEANFLLVRAGGRARELRRGLAERGILVREVGHYPGLEGCFRVAIGSGAALRATREALETMLDATPSSVGGNNR